MLFVALMRCVAMCFGIVLGGDEQSRYHEGYVIFLRGMSEIVYGQELRGWQQQQQEKGAYHRTIFTVYRQEDRQVNAMTLIRAMGYAADNVLERCRIKCERSVDATLMYAHV